MTSTTDCNGDFPVIKDPDKIVVGDCDAPKGGTKTVESPLYKLVVKNPEKGDEFLPGS